MKYRVLMMIALSVALSACGKSQATCSDDASKAALESAIREGLEKVVGAQTKDSEGKQIVGFSKIRAAIADLKFVIENIRTTKEDPNSTKKFCTSNIKIVFGAQVFTDSNKAREIAGLTNLTEAADTAGIEKGVDYLKGDLDYSVQPTDDGSKVISEFEAADAKLDVFGEVVAASLLRSGLENKQRIDQENAAIAEKQQQDAVSAERQANVEQAAVAQKSADLAIAEMWKALSPEIRQALLPQQRAWIKSKDASCIVQGLQSSTDPAEQRVAKLNCITNETQRRTSLLQEYLNNNPVEDSDRRM